MSALGKEDPLLEVDSQPFLASSYSDAMKLYKASKAEIVKGLEQKRSSLFICCTMASSRLVQVKKKLIL